MISCGWCFEALLPTVSKRIKQNKHHKEFIPAVLETEEKEQWWTGKGPR